MQMLFLHQMLVCIDSLLANQGLSCKAAAAYQT